MGNDLGDVGLYASLTYDAMGVAPHLVRERDARTRSSTWTP